MHGLLKKSGLGKVFALLTLMLSAGVLAFVLSRPQKIQAKDTRLSQRAAILYFSERPFTGTLISKYENGALYQETPYVDGKIEGLMTEYALNGHVREISRYHLGLRDGLQEGWYMEGPKFFEHNFKAGLLDGLQTDWHMNGTIFRQEIFAQGIKTDKKIFFQQGGIFTNYAVRDGRIYGLDGGALCMENRVREGEK